MNSFTRSAWSRISEPSAPIGLMMKHRRGVLAIGVSCVPTIISSFGSMVACLQHSANALRRRNLNRPTTPYFSDSPDAVVETILMDPQRQLAWRQAKDHSRRGGVIAYVTGVARSQPTDSRRAAFQNGAYAADIFCV